MRRGLYCAAAIAAACGCLCGCGRQETDILKQAEKRGILTVAMPERDEADRSAKRASDMEKQVIDALCQERKLQVRYVYTAQDDLTESVEEKRADIAAGALVMEDGRNQGYSITYGCKPVYLVSGEGSGVSSMGSLTKQTVGIAAGLGADVKSQFYPVTGIELAEYQDTGEVKAHIEQGKIAGYVCYEKDARSMLAQGGLWVQDLTRIQAESYAFYTGEGQYRILGEIDRLLTEKLRE